MKRERERGERGEERDRKRDRERGEERREMEMEREGERREERKRVMENERDDARDEGFAQQQRDYDCKVMLNKNIIGVCGWCVDSILAGVHMEV